MSSELYGPWISYFSGRVSLHRIYKGLTVLISRLAALKRSFQDCVAKALVVIKWMNNHSRALGLFLQEQVFTYHKFLALILPVITRWTAHFFSLRRLLTVEKALKFAWLKHSETMIASAGSKNEDQEKAIAVHEIINDPRFWYPVKK